MINGKSVIAIIPARGGSKGLPGKNIKPLCGKPLIAWTIDAGLSSQYVDEVMVTTDSEEIARIARELGASVPFLRPIELSSDTASSFDAVKHAIDFYQAEKQKIFDYVVLLEPTSPLRETDDIDRMLDKISLLADEYDAIISLGEVNEHPSIIKNIKGNSVDAYYIDLPATSRRQDNNVAYFPYGVAYIIKTKILLEEKSFYPRHTTYFLIKRYQCYEVDDLYDFLAIENIMKYEWHIE